MKALLFLALASAGAHASTDYLFQLQQVDFGSTAEGRLVLDQAPGAGMTTFSVADGTLLHVDFFYDPTAPVAPGTYGGLWWNASQPISEEPAVATFSDGTLVNLTYRIDYQDQSYEFLAKDLHYYQGGPGWGDEWQVVQQAPVTGVSPVPESPAYLLSLLGIAALIGRCRSLRIRGLSGPGSTPRC